MKTTDRDLISFPLYFAVALVSGSILAYELFVMRVFANGGWSHFGSTVISIAMFGFGVFSTALCIWKRSFTERVFLWVNISLLLLGPAMMIANSVAQTVPFNPIFLVSDPNQKFYLAYYFILYFVPFLCGAMFLGLVFLMGQHKFGKVYFANMAGSGVGSLALFVSMYYLLPERLFLVPLALWFAGALLWLHNQGRAKVIPALVLSAALSVTIGWQFPQISVSPYKGVSYAKKFPDSRQIYEAMSPFGYLEVYSSSYFHFAPGLSDAATLYLDKMPEKAYLGMYIDGDGPIGIMKHLSEAESEYFKFLPLYMPYLLKQDPEVLVMQFGGGISTNVALEMGSKRITVAEGNPMVIQAVEEKNMISKFTGDILQNPRVHLISYDGRIFVGRERESFDIIDLSLADSTGLSMPGGFSIYEKYTYTEETFLSCIRSLKDKGLLAVTVWNKEDPPKSTLKLMATMFKAARAINPNEAARDFYIAHTYLSTLSVLYKKGGFSEGEIQKLDKYCKKMNFETIYAPGHEPVDGGLDNVFEAYQNAYFAPQENESLGEDVDMSVSNLYKLVVSRLMEGDFKGVEEGYVFNVDPLTNDRPYFAGFVKFGDIPKFADKLETISDEWGYLLLWATLFSSIFFGLILLLLPVIFGWKAIFAKSRGKLSIVVYFLCLGIGYMLVEIGMISKYILSLGNTTVSVTVLITGMLLFSGLGSYVSGRFSSRPGGAMVFICTAIAANLVVYAFFLNSILNLVGFWPYSAKILFCLVLLFPLAFLMGFPFAMGMAMLSNLKKEHFFVWAWGINGSFSVVGSTLVPLISVILGLSWVILISAGIYLIALPCFLRLQRPEVQGAA